MTTFTTINRKKTWKTLAYDRKINPKKYEPKVRKSQKKD